MVAPCSQDKKTTLESLNNRSVAHLAQRHNTLRCGRDKATLLGDMEATVNLIKATSDDPGKLAAQLGAQSASLSQQSPANLSQALTALDPAQHSLGYLFIL